MAMSLNTSLHSLNGDDFYYTFQTTPTPELHHRDLSFQNDAVEQINARNDIDFEFDLNDSTSQIVSEYYTEDQFTSSWSPSGNDFTMLHLNIRSISKNFDSFRILIEGLSFNCSVIGLSETWFSDHSPSLFSLPNYNLVVNNRPDKAGGGVGLYISRQFDYVVRA